VHQAIDAGGQTDKYAKIGDRLDRALDAMNDALVRGHRIEIRGFGSFSINRRSPRIGRNPRSGESVAIPEKRVPHFKPGKALREAVDRRTSELAQQRKT